MQLARLFRLSGRSMMYCTVYTARTRVRSFPQCGSHLRAYCIRMLISRDKPRVWQHCRTLFAGKRAVIRYSGDIWYCINTTPKGAICSWAAQKQSSFYTCIQYGTHVAIGEHILNRQPYVSKLFMTKYREYAVTVNSRLNILREIRKINVPQIFPLLQY